MKNVNGAMVFERQDGIFKKFVEQARTNFDNSQKSQEVVKKEASVQEQMTSYFSSFGLGKDELEISRGTKFYITSVDDKRIEIYIPENKISKRLSLKTKELKELLESDQKFDQVKDVTAFFGRKNGLQDDSYYLTIYNEIRAKSVPVSMSPPVQEKLKPYIFIIDEINRGEISKIFGELFFSIDPGYRGQAGEVSTQYANLHENPDDKFYIPENVYIIGTMNDIDRSVDSFDFAMRRRFRFIEIKSDERLEMLDALAGVKEDAIKRMTALNREINEVDELNENYHIGASYFLKLKYLTFDQLWIDYLQPLLQEYVRGMHGEVDIMKKFAKAYGYVIDEAGDRDDTTQD